ncbi:MAG: iron ABC transporter permease [Acidobacteria bacterium]|nr:iron ABC transporter permease [Acidobacteriota bacterium]
MSLAATQPAVPGGSSAAAARTPRADASAVLVHYRRTVRRRVLLLAALAVCLCATVALDLVTGPSRMTAVDVLRGVVSLGNLDATQSVIIWQIRLPQALMALLVGAALALAGTEMQTTLNNPLASPFTLGMSSAAIFGAALAIVLEISIPGVPAQWIVPANAFVFALFSVMILRAAASRGTGGSETLVLLGIALFFTFNALVAITQFVATEQALQQLVFWTMGSLGRASWPEVRVLAIVIAFVLPFVIRASWRLTALRLGEERARAMAIDVRRLRLHSLLRVSLLTATAVSFVGTIAFVGLVGPHIGRLLVGEDHRFLIPASALSGALILSAASVVSKLIIPGVLIPIGLVTALIGVPFFVWLIWRRGSFA